MEEIYQDADGDVMLGVTDDGSAILLKVFATFGDPVELTPEAARELANQLLAIAERLD